MTINPSFSLAEVRLGRGVRRRLAPEPDTFRADLRAWTEALPEDAAFSGPTAARLHGLWLPPLPNDVPVFVATSTSTRIRRPQLRTVRHPARLDRRIVDGIPVVSITETVVSCARGLGVLDLVVLADSAMRELGGTTELGHAATARRRGAPALRQALALADIRSESPWETLLRVLHLTCDVPVIPQAEIWDQSGFVARADLLIEGTRVLQEYDGSHHFDREQYRADRRRDDRLTLARYVRHGYLTRDVLADARHILRNADSALERRHEAHRLERWHALMRESLFSAAGRAAAARRWRAHTGPFK